MGEIKKKVVSTFWFADSFTMTNKNFWEYFRLNIEQLHVWLSLVELTSQPKPKRKLKTHEISILQKQSNLRSRLPW